MILLQFHQSVHSLKMFIFTMRQQKEVVVLGRGGDWCQAGIETYGIGHIICPDSWFYSAHLLQPSSVPFSVHFEKYRDNSNQH